MNDILTILNCGTNFSWSNNDIVADLAKNHLPLNEEISVFSVKDEVRKGIVTDVERGTGPRRFFGLVPGKSEIRSATREFGTWMINTGPGGGKTTRPGSFEPITGEKTFLETHNDLFDFPEFTRGYRSGTFAAAITGKGMEHNVIRSVAVIDQIVSLGILKNMPTLRKVNMVGWSRGAVTCHITAHALSHYRHQNAQVQATVRALPVAIFAFDPVPGGDPQGSPYRDPEKIDIPANVTRYFGIYAENDKRHWFQPVVIQPRAGLTLERVVIPGDHSIIVQAKKGLGEAVDIGRALCHQFLLDEGTELADADTLTESQLIEKYAEMAVKIEKYQKLIGSLLTSGGRQQRQLNIPKADADEFFVNAHHEKLFRDSLGGIYQRLFVSHQPLVSFQSRLLQIRLPKTSAALRELGLL